MKKIMLLLAVLCSLHVLYSQDLYPTNWFTGMKNQNLQLMIHQENIATKIPMYKMSAAGMKLADGVTLKLIRRTENPNYIFLDLVIDKTAKPGMRSFSFGAGERAVKFNYELKARDSADGKTRVQGVTSKDFVYLLIPDRFANGDPSNDIIKDYRDQSNERTNKFSRHGGDFKGISNHFDYLAGLGVTTLWMTPVIENNTALMHEFGNDVAGYHGYWFTDHYQVDKRLGGNDGYQSLCKEAHDKRFKIIQDAVYNHVSKQHWFILDPPEKEWINNWPEFTSTNHREEVFFDPYASAYDKTIMLDGWFVDHLPDLNQRNPLVANFLIQHAIWTTETFGIDGWRVDTYKYCDEEFLNTINTRLLTEFPALTIFGEAATNSVIGNAYFTQNKINTAFKHNAGGVLDFQVSNAMLSGLNLTQGWTDGVNRLYMTLAADAVYVKPANNCIFLDNHDMDRVYSIAGEDWSKLKIGLTWLLTLRGIPQLYYGTEILMKNFKNPTDALVREDFPGGWSADKTDKFNQVNRSEKENTAYNYISALAKFRKTSTALTTGKTTQFLPKDGNYIFFRYDAAQTIMVVANTSDKKATPVWANFNERTAGFSRVKNVITGVVQPLAALTIEPKETAVYEMLK